jgi:hypothetical protein
MYTRQKAAMGDAAWYVHQTRAAMEDAAWYVHQTKLRFPSMVSVFPVLSLTGVLYAIHFPFWMNNYGTIYICAWKHSKILIITFILL